MFAGFWVVERELFGVEEEAVEYADVVFYINVVDGVVAAFVVGSVADDRMVY